MRGEDGSREVGGEESGRKVGDVEVGGVEGCEGEG